MPNTTQSTKSTNGRKSTSGRKTSSDNGSSRLSKGKVLAAAAGVAAAAAVGYATLRNGSKSRTTYHLLPNDEGWEIRAEGADRATKKFDTKDEALDAARDLARNAEPSQLIIHRTDGTVSTSHTYGETA